MEQNRKRGRPSAVERNSRRRHILDVASELFARGGFGATTIEAIAVEASVAKRTIYSYFGDKTGVFTAAVDQQHSTLTETLEGFEDLDVVAARIIYTMHSEKAVALHRLVIAEAGRMPRLAAAFYEHGPARSITLLRSRLSTQEQSPAPEMAEALYSLLLGEHHRRRLLGLSPAPTAEESREYARQAIAALCFSHADPID